MIPAIRIRNYRRGKGSKTENNRISTKSIEDATRVTSMTSLTIQEITTKRENELKQIQDGMKEKLCPFGYLLFGLDFETSQREEDTEMLASFTRRRIGELTPL
jgi:hypothetical protein